MAWEDLDQETRDLFEGTYRRDEGLDPAAIWAQQNAANNPPGHWVATAPTVPVTTVVNPTVSIAKVLRQQSDTNTPAAQAGYQTPDWLRELLGRPLYPPGFERRLALQGFTPRPGKDRLSRSLAALWSNVPDVRELAVNAADFGATDYQSAAKRYLAGLGDAGKDPVAYAVAQGFMPKLPPRTISELVDERTLQILKGQGLVAPGLQASLNKQLEDAYQAELAGTEPPKLEPVPGGGGMLLPIPSMQLYGQDLNVGEREGVISLAKALGLTSEQFLDQITRLAPPTGRAATAQQVFRRL
mgnify:CR=1 FL=1